MCGGGGGGGNANSKEQSGGGGGGGYFATGILPAGEHVVAIGKGGGYNTAGEATTLNVDEVVANGGAKNGPNVDRYGGKGGSGGGYGCYISSNSFVNDSTS